MKKIYLKNNNGGKSIESSRIIDVDNLSFVFNRMDGSVYATSTSYAKTSNIKLIKHPNWIGLKQIDKSNFETMVMDKLSEAIERLFTSDCFKLEIDFDCSEISVVYTFTIYNHATLSTRFTDKIEIQLFDEEEQ